MVLLDTGTPGTSGEIYSEDADDGTRSTRFITERLRVRVPSSTEHHGNVTVWAYKVSVCVGLQNKMHMFREYFLSFTTSKTTEKSELTKGYWQKFSHSLLTLR